MKSFILASLAGIMIGVALRCSGFGFLMLVAWGPLFLGAWRVGPVGAALSGWWTVFLADCVGYWWISETAMQALEGSSWGVRLLLPMLAAVHGLLGAALALSARALEPLRGAARWAVPALIAVAAYAAVAEHAPPMIRAGWTYSFTLAKSPWLLQVAELGGPGAVDGMLVLSGWCTAALVSRRSKCAGVAAPCAILALLLLAGLLRFAHVEHVTRHEGSSIKVALLQPGRGFQDDQESTLESAAAARWLQKQTRQAARREIDLTVWPESAWPYPINRRRTSDFHDDHTWHMTAGRGALLVGAMTKAEDGSTFNSSILMDESGEITGAYDKRLLFELGETETLDALLEAVGLSRSNLRRSMPIVRRGSGPRLLASERFCIAPLLCSEEIVPMQLTADELAAVDLVTAQASSAWMTHVTAARQQLGHAVLRAIESRRSYVRAASDSHSAALLPSGRVQAITSEAEGAQVLDVEVPSVQMPSLFPWIRPHVALLSALAIIAFILGSRSRSSASSRVAGLGSRTR